MSCAIFRKWGDTIAVCALAFYIAIEEFVILSPVSGHVFRNVSGTANAALSLCFNANFFELLPGISTVTIAGSIIEAFLVQISD